MAELEPPHADYAVPRLMQVVARDAPPVLQSKQKWSPAMHRFVGRCLTKDPEQRPRAAELLDDPFVAAYTDTPPPDFIELLARARLQAEAEAAPAGPFRDFDSDTGYSHTPRSPLHDGDGDNLNNDDAQSTGSGASCVAVLDPTGDADVPAPHAIFPEPTAAAAGGAVGAAAGTGGAQWAVTGAANADALAAGAEAQPLAAPVPAAFDGALPPLPTLSLDDFTLDELAPAALAARTTPPARIFEWLRAEDAAGQLVSAANSRGPPACGILHPTATLANVFHKLRYEQLQSVVVQKAGAQRAHALAETLGSFLKTTLHA